MVLTPKDFTLTANETREVNIELMISSLWLNREKKEWIMIKGEFFDQKLPVLINPEWKWSTSCAEEGFITSLKKEEDPELISLWKQVEEFKAKENVFEWVKQLL